jgi:Tol biopolymer transport system component
MRFRAVVPLLCFLGAIPSSAAALNELWVINADGTGLKRLVDTPGYTCGSPEWSPDNKWIAYDTWKAGQNLEESQIAVVRADGTGLKILGIGAMPSWSPDGAQLVFHQYGVNNDGTRNGNEDSIVVMNADGTGREQILQHWGSPRWARRGNRIVSILDNNLAVYDLETGIERTILPRPESMYWGFGISPDGTRICFGGYSASLFLATLDERSMKAASRTLVPAGKCHYPSFAPDGRRIVFSWFRDGDKVAQLYTMDVDADKEPKLLAGQAPNQSSWGPNWSPDGKTIVFASRRVELQQKDALKVE